MSTFTPKRPDSRLKELRYTESKKYLSKNHSSTGKFEKEKAVLNERKSVPRMGKNCKKREEIESKRPSPIAMNPEAPTRNAKATPTFQSSPDNPLTRSRSADSHSSTASLRNSSRYAARIKFEASRNTGTVSDENKFAGQWEACRQVKDAKVKESHVLKDHPHGATQGIIYHKRPEGLSLPGLGFGGSCQS